MCDVEAWFFVQQCVDSFTDRCTKLARRLANFIKIIQQEDISLLDNYDCMREVRAQNWFYFLTLLLYTSVATKLRRSSKLRRFLSEDPSSSSSSVHFQMLKNLRSFEDFRPKIAKIFWENLPIFWTKLSEKV